MTKTKLKTATLLFAFCGLLTQPIQAQFEYRQYLYPSSSVGSPDLYKLSSVALGNLHSPTGLGGYHVIGTYATSPVSSANYNFEIRVTDGYGDYASATPWSLFNSFHIYLDNTLCNGSALNIAPDTYGMSVIETGNAVPIAPPSDAFYAVVATAGIGTRKGCVFTLLQSEGAPVAVANNSAFYEFPPGATNISKPYITESSNPGTYYICGSYFLNTQDELYVIKVNAGVGGISSPAWINAYTSGRTLRPAGVLESPHNPNHLVIAGTNVQTSNNRGLDGFFMKLDVTTGSTGGVLVFKVYGNTGSVENEFTSIAPAFSNSIPRPKGYVIGGKTAGTPGFTSWMLKLDQNGVIGWNRALQASTGTNQEISGVLERASVNNIYDYFGATSTGSGNMTVFKLDDNGNLNFTGTGSNEFVYSPSTAYPDGPAYITAINNGSSYGDGLNVFGCDLNTNKVYAVKSYFSGESGCNESISNSAMDMSGPNSVLTPPCNVNPAQITLCTDVQINPVQRVWGNPLPTAFQGVLQCGANFISGASNLRTAANSGLKAALTNDMGFEAFPNPATDQITLSYNISTPGKVEIDLYNYTGQHVKNLRSAEAASGSYTENINLSALNLSGGVYFITAKTQTESYRQKIIIKD